MGFGGMPGLGPLITAAALLIISILSPIPNVAIVSDTSNIPYHSMSLGFVTKGAQSLLHSILFYSILFYSILVYSILFYSILFYSILFYSILFYYSRV